MLTLGMMPWTWQFNFANTLGFIILGGILSWHSDALILSAAVYLFLAFYLLFRNSRNLIAFCNSTIIQPFLMQLRGIRDSKSIADLLAESVVLATDSSGCLILIGRNQEWELTGLGENLDDKDRFLIADFGVSLKEQNSRCKVLPITEINRLFHPFLDSWFGFLPSRVVYFSVALKTNLGMESISGLVPVSPTLRLADWNQVQRSICSLLELAESGGDTIRRASKGTHTFISPFRSDLNQDEELGEVIHHVNNAAQDLSVVSESITKQFQSLSEMSFEQQDRIRAQALSDQIKQHVINLSETIRYLSTSVSDIRWLKEASHSPVPEKLESVNLREILEDVSSYALFKLRRSGALVKLTASQEDLGNIQVESREFLEALLRAVLRIAGRGLKKESSCVISDLSGVDVSGIRLTFSGISHNSFYDIFGGSRDEEVLRTLRRFVDNSRGTLLLEKSSIIPEAADISLSFRNVDRKVSAPQVVGGWALLIDDKPEIVNFYGSVAEALGLKCGAATNLTEARNLLNERDLPNIVVTDIQLDQENGLDFVREVRDRHGLAVPIIVVSGNTEEHIRAQVFSAGATKYLTKPVGRRKLFLEIKDLLGKR
jgi:CheY-like chemotaxis protein